MKKKKHLFRKILLSLLAITVAGLLLPQNLQMPVEGAGRNSYNQQSFWYYPWGDHAHQGVDIFARKGTPVRAATYGVVLYAGVRGIGGNCVIMLGPKWRLQLYSHLDTIHAKPFQFVGHRTVIGTVGDTGNAKGKPPHLHYGIATLIPYPWRIDDAPYGWQKCFYLNPIPLLNKVTE